jgi:hypothetical protein
MSYHLAALRLRSIGERSARFTDLTLDLTAPQNTGLIGPGTTEPGLQGSGLQGSGLQGSGLPGSGLPGVVGTPSDSLVWLRNGGGKSSLLSLFYALLLPHANDFMGRAVKRSLTDYVDSGDTAHTVAVWHSVDSPTLLGEPDKILVTGAIYEWQDLRRPADPEKDRDRLTVSYYAFYAVPGVVDAHCLPFTGPDGQPLRRSAVVAALRDLAAQHPTAMDLSLPKSQREWSVELAARGIDPELYRRQKEMNHVEGGVEDLFRFASTREFVDFLLDLTVPPDKAADVANRLSKIADLLATKPVKTQERDFCADAVVALGRIGSTSADLDLARKQVARAVEHAQELASRFAGTVREAGQAQEFLARQSDALGEALTRARRDQADAWELAQGYRHRAAELRLTTATQALGRAKESAARATTTVEAWRLTQHLAEQADLTAQLQQVRAEAGRERENTAPLRAACDEHAVRLLLRLTVLAEQADVEAGRAAATAGEQRDREAEYAEGAAAARERLNEAVGRAATARSRLSDLDTRLAEAVAAGLLPGSGADPVAALATAGAQQEELRAALADLRGRRAARPAERASLTQRLTRLSAEQTGLDGERSALVKQLDDAQAQARRITGDTRVRDLVEADGDEPVDLWAESGTLTRRLVDEVRSADETLIRLEAARMDEQRVLDGQARTGLLPTSLDASRLLALLAEHEVPAEAGWAHLRDVCPAPRLREALTDPELARLGCGIVVPTDRAAGAAALLTGADATTASLVGVYTAADAAELVARSLDGGASAHPAVWTGLHRGLVDPLVAESAATAIRVRQSADDTRRDELVRRRDADRALLGRIEALLQRCPVGHVDVLARRVSELDAALEEIAAGLARTGEELAESERADAADTDTERELTARLETIGASLVQLRTLAEAASQAPQWREHLATAEQHADAERADAERREQGRLAAGAQAQRWERVAAQARDAAQEHRTAAAGITFLEQRPEGIEDDPAVPLDSLRRTHAEATRALESRLSESVLAERERGLAERLRQVGAALATAAEEHLAVARELMATGGAQTQQARTRAARDADEAKSEANAAVGAAQAEVVAAQHELTTLGRRRTRPAHSLPGSPRTLQEAVGLALEQEQAAARAAEKLREAELRLQALEVERSRTEERGKVFEHLLDGLGVEGQRLEGQRGDGQRGDGQRGDGQRDAAGIRPGEPYAGDDRQARQEKLATAQALAVARARLVEAEKALTAAVAAARAVGARYPTVRTPARERILEDPEPAMAASATDLITNLQLRADMIEEELAGIAKDQDIVAASLAHLVDDTLDNLRKAERYSRLPASLGPWAGKQMLRISFDTPTSEADLRAYVDRVIERRVADGVKPQGMPLLKDAVHEAVGPRGFTVKVLKPTQEVTSTSEDITRLGKWSGGEKLTVCVALYCTLAALRARNTGRGNASGGVLVLDNPIGRASHGTLVRLQRDVAAAHGVQLIYTTGVKDPEAVSRFPNVIRLANRPGRTRNRRFIVTDEPVLAVQADDPADEEHELREVTGTRVAHDEPASTTPDDAPAAPVPAEVVPS